VNFEKLITIVRRLDCIVIYCSLEGTQITALNSLEISKVQRCICLNHGDSQEQPQRLGTY